MLLRKHVLDEVGKILAILLRKHVLDEVKVRNKVGKILNSKNLSTS